MNFEEYLQSIFNNCNFNEISDGQLLEVYQKFNDRLVLLINLTEYEQHIFETVVQEIELRGLNG